MKKILLILAFLAASTPAWALYRINQYTQLPDFYETGGSGGGDVNGPGSSTSGHFASFGDSSGKLIADSGKNAASFEVPLTFSTGVTRTVNTVTVNTSQNIATLSNLTTNGFVKTGSGNGTLSVDNTVYLSSVTADSPLSGSGTSASHLVIANAAADGSTKGAASFTANDFDASAGNISLDYTNGQKASGSVPGFSTANQTIGVVGITIDGGGSAVTTGSKGFITVPYAGTITNWYMAADQSGSAVIDVKRSGTSIVGAGNKPTLSSAQSGNAAVSSWTSTAISAGDILEFNVGSASTLTRVTLTIKVNKS